MCEGHWQPVLYLLTCRSLLASRWRRRPACPRRHDDHQQTSESCGRTNDAHDDAGAQLDSNGKHWKDPQYDGLALGGQVWAIHTVHNSNTDPPRTSHCTVRKPLATGIDCRPDLVGLPRVRTSKYSTWALGEKKNGEAKLKEARRWTGIMARWASY